MSSANFKCIPLLNLLRFQGGELEECVFDAKFQDFMAAAKSDLEKAQTQKAKALIYHATISAQLVFLERKGFEAEAMKDLALEVESRVSGKQVDFAFDLPTKSNAKTMPDEKRWAKVLALYITKPENRKQLFKFSRDYADLGETQIKDLLKNFNRNRSGDKIFASILGWVIETGYLTPDDLRATDVSSLENALTKAAKAAAFNCEHSGCNPPWRHQTEL